MKKHKAEQFGLYKNKLPHSIIEVVATLQRAGFEAYIVGGGVRDSLLGLAPKDFDAVTNARPHEIKDLFGSRCRIIGKRFLLAHVYSGREMIEVATFRAAPVGDQHKSHDGMIVRDNVWGDIKDDFIRRDFTINALYYDPIGGEILDFCGALDDIKNKKIKLLGKPKLRIEEDPVRLLRALRFKAKLGFEFDKSLEKQFNDKNWQLLENVSAHRLYDETQKMFAGGYLTALLPLLYHYGATKVLLAHSDDTPTPLMMTVAQSSDERIQDGRGANPAYFYATLLWDNYLYHLNKFKKKLPFYDAQIKAANRTMDRQRVRTAIPKFAEEFITQIWLMQPRLSQFKASDVLNLASHPRFRASFDFLVAREQADTNSLSEPTNGMGKWWSEFLLFDDKARQAMIDNLGTPSLRRRTKTNKQKINAELEQLKQLSLDSDTSKTKARPLFETVPMPPKIKRVKTVFDTTCYTDADFEKLLGDEPFIPYKRQHKSHMHPINVAQTNDTPKQPSSSGFDQITDKPKTDKPPKSVATKQPSHKPKSRRKSTKPKSQANE